MCKSLTFHISVFTLLLLLTACKSQYEVTNVSRERIIVDNRYDGVINPEVEAFIAPYRAMVDSIMCPIVGYTTTAMAAKKPESNLSNLLCDILIWAGSRYGEEPVFSVYNMGGIRSAFPAGAVNQGNVLEVAPFENKICFLDLKGDAVLELFEQIAHNRGEGVSSAVRVTMTERGELLDVTINGEAVDKDKTYRIATLDFVAQGNDNLYAFQKLSNLNSPQEEQNNIRYIIADYFLEKNAAGEKVSAEVEGRIVVK